MTEIETLIANEPYCFRSCARNVDNGVFMDLIYPLWGVAAALPQRLILLESRNDPPKWREGLDCQQKNLVANP